MIENLKQFVRDSIKSHPQHKDEIMELYHLCWSEIEEGGSMENEINLCIRDIEELIKS
jgi:hypothetical protein